MENILIIPQHKISRFVQVTGFIFFGVLFYFCWRFYKERMLSFDGAFYVFQFMQSGKLVQNLERYGDYIPQLLPWLAYKMGASLNTILILYSVSFILLHYLIFLIVTLLLKNDGAGIAIMLASCLAYFHAFYAPMMQLNESIIAAVMLWALIHPEAPYYSAKGRLYSTIGAIGVIVYMSFLHPLGIALIVFVIGIEILGAKRFKDNHLWLILLIGLGWYLLKCLMLFPTDYDRDHIIPLSTILHQLPHWKQWPSTHYVDALTWLHFRSLKWLGVALILLSLRKGILFFLFLLVYIICFSLAYFVTLYRGESPISYEYYYCCYGFFAGLIFVFLIYHPRRKNLILVLTIPLLYIGVKNIYRP